MNALHKQLLRLVDDDVFFQDQTQNLWYNDPSVIFEQSKAELDYQQTLQASIVQLYILAQQLASRWAEAYQNPYRKGDGATFASLGTVGEFDDFTEPESAFNITDNVMAKKFYAALNDWSTRLQSQRPSPLGTAPPTTISLRQDLLGLSDYSWDTNAFAFKPDPIKQQRNIQIFSALVLNALTPQSPRHIFEFEFGINYFSPRKSVASAIPALLIPQNSGDWNQRLSNVSASVIGANVTQDTKIPFLIYQFGRIYNEGFFDQADTARVDNLPLYYRDPRMLPLNLRWEGNQQFRLDAAVSQNVPVKTSLAGQAISPFCDRYLLVIEQSALVAPVNFQNITDINLTLEWTSGRPPQFNWPDVQ
jgi:hypothetical protein